MPGSSRRGWYRPASSGRRSRSASDVLHDRPGAIGPGARANGLSSSALRWRQEEPMRLSHFTALSVVAAALLVASGSAQSTHGDGREFSAAALTAPPATRWATNGGNLSNQRFSPLSAINRGNVAQLKGVWRTRLRG